MFNSRVESIVENYQWFVFLLRCGQPRSNQLHSIKALIPDGEEAHLMALSFEKWLILNADPLVSSFKFTSRIHSIDHREADQVQSSSISRFGRSERVEGRITMNLLDSVVI